MELKGAITARGYSATKVAAEISVDYSTLHRYFKGQRSLPSDVFSNACEYIGVDPADLVDRAYSRLIDEMGEYSPIEEAEIVSLYTPPQGIPLNVAAKDPGYSPQDQLDGETGI